MTGLREDEREALATALAMLLHDHRPEPLLPPLLVSGCKCGWGSEVFSHSAHQANEVGKYLAAQAAQTDASETVTEWGVRNGGTDEWFTFSDERVARIVGREQRQQVHSRTVTTAPWQLALTNEPQP